MKKEEIKTPEDLLDYIMQEYESTGAFTLRELENIRDSYEEWAIADFDYLRNESFKNIDRMIFDGIREDYKDYVSSREFCDRH